MLSPLELENKRILTSKRKYDRFEMDEYLDMIFENYKALYAEYEDQKKQIKTLTDGIQYYRSIESTMQKALILAEKTSKETKDAAMLKAESIEKDALGKADRIINEAENEYNRIREKCLALVQQFNNYKAQLQIAAKEQLKLITSATFDVDTPDSLEQTPYESSMTAEQLSAMADAQYQSQDYQYQTTEPGFDALSAGSDQFTQQDQFAQEEPADQSSSVYTFTGDTQPLPDISSMVSTGSEPVYPQDEPGIPVPQQPAMTEEQAPVIPEQSVAPASDPEDITSQFEMYTEETAPEPAFEQATTPVAQNVGQAQTFTAEPALEPVPAPKPERLEPVPDKTMVLPDVTGIERTARRAVRQAMTEEEALSLMNAETINLGDSIKEVRTHEESLQVPEKNTNTTEQLVLEPAPPEHVMSHNTPQGLDSILQNMSIGKKKKNNGVTDEDPFEFLGSVDDF